MNLILRIIGAVLTLVGAVIVGYTLRVTSGLVVFPIAGVGLLVLGTYLFSHPATAKPDLVQLPEPRADTVPPSLRRVGVAGTDLIEIIGEPDDTGTKTDLQELR